MTVNIRGKQYVTVAERVAAAHEDTAAEFSIVGGDIITIGNTGRWWYQATIRVRNQLYLGTAEIKFGAKPGTPDAENPVECAETSAIGRALAFAGIGATESIASADEVQRTESQVQQQPQRERVSGIHARVKFNALSDIEYRQRAKALGYHSVSQIEELLARARLTVETATREQAFAALEVEERKAREAASTQPHSLKLGEHERTATP